jgi:hypothetical protein
MKSFCLYNDTGYSILVKTNDNLELTENIRELGLRIGNYLNIFLINNETFSYRELPYYTKPYSNEDKYDYLIDKFPGKKMVLDKLITTFDLQYL